MQTHWRVSHPTGVGGTAGPARARPTGRAHALSHFQAEDPSATMKNPMAASSGGGGKVADVECGRGPLSVAVLGFVAALDNRVRRNRVRRGQPAEARSEPRSR